jgi:hypothetical protein
MDRHTCEVPEEKYVVSERADFVSSATTDESTRYALPASA